ncbi:hypothetical protein D3C87_1547530 [compost metagenome]
MPEDGRGGGGVRAASRIAAVASAPAATAISKAVLPEGSSKLWSAPADSSSLQTSGLLREADSMRGVKPRASRALRSSPRSMWI